jgi:hypothetical protein
MKQEGLISRIHQTLTLDLGHPPKGEATVGSPNLQLLVVP